jgi:translation initiation factor 3 subunit C
MSRFFKRAGDSSDSESSSSEEEELMSSDDEAPSAPAPTTKQPMSRFLKGAAGSDSDSSSDSDDDSDSDSDEASGQKKKSRFLAGGGSDAEDSDEDTKKVVKSAKDKRVEEMEATGKVIENGLKINDWVAISNGGTIVLV